MKVRQDRYAFVEILGSIETEFVQQLLVNKVFLNPLLDEELIKRLMATIITMEEKPVKVFIT